MTDPFESLMQPEEDWELVEESALACQKCNKIVREGRYYEQKELLTWKCPCGHLSNLKVKL